MAPEEEKTDCSGAKRCENHSLTLCQNVLLKCEHSFFREILIVVLYDEEFLHELTCYPSAQENFGPKQLVTREPRWHDQSLAPTARATGGSKSQLIDHAN